MKKIILSFILLSLGSLVQDPAIKKSFRKEVKKNPAFAGFFYYGLQQVLVMLPFLTGPKIQVLLLQAP